MNLLSSSISCNEDMAVFHSLKYVVALNDALLIRFAEKIGTDASEAFALEEVKTTCGLGNLARCWFVEAIPERYLFQQLQNQIGEHAQYISVQPRNVLRLLN